MDQFRQNLKAEVDYGKMLETKTLFFCYPFSIKVIMGYMFQRCINLISYSLECRKSILTLIMFKTELSALKECSSLHAFDMPKSD